MNRRSVLRKKLQLYLFIGIRDHNMATNGSASENENASTVSPEAEEVSALVSALAHQQSEAESEAAAEEARQEELKNKSNSDPSNLHLAKGRIIREVQQIFKF